MITPTLASAGELEPPPGGPDAPAAALFSLEALYDRLAAGTPGTPRTGNFVEPSSGPSAGTGHSLNEIMAIAPAEDNGAGASPDEVMAGRTFWSLRTDGTWGPQTGSLPTQVIDASTVSQAAGNYAAFDLSNPADGGDADLVGTNIRGGTILFGVAGSPNVVDTTSGDASAADLLIGRTAWVDGLEISGSMPDNEGDNASTAQSAAGGINRLTAPTGFYDGDDTVTASDAQIAALDGNLVSGNVAAGATIFGVAGDPDVVNTGSGTATAAELLAGRVAWVDGAQVTGTMADREGDHASTAQSAAGGINRLVAPTGFYDGDDAVTASDAQIAALDPDLVAANIASGIEVFGVAGELETGCGCTGTLSPGGRWCSNGDGTVTDMLHGCLVWLQDTNCPGATAWTEPANGSPPGANARASFLSTTECGLTDGSVDGDWRLPSTREVIALITGPEAITSSTPGPFSIAAPYFFWSASGREASPEFAVFVNLNGTGLIDGALKSQTNLKVWPVRNAQ